MSNDSGEPWVEVTLDWLFEIGSGEAYRGPQGDIEIYGANGPIGLARRANFDGGFVIGRVGASGAVTDVPSRVWASDNTLTARPRASRCDSRFAAHLLRSLELPRLATRTAQPLLTQTTVKRLRTTVPRDLNVQRRIAERLDDAAELMFETERMVRKFEAIRSGLLGRLITSGIDEDGRIRELGESTPEDWETLSLATAAAAPIGYGIVQPGPYASDGVPVLAIKDLQGDYQTGLHRARRTVEAAYARSRIRGDDVLLSVKGTTGRVGLVPRHFQGNISRDLARIRCGPRVVPAFLRYTLEASVTQARLTRITVGTTRAEISIWMLREFAITVPSIPEQRRVVGALGALDRRLNEEREYRDKMRLVQVGLAADLLSSPAAPRLSGDVPATDGAREAGEVFAA